MRLARHFQKGFQTLFCPARISTQSHFQAITAYSLNRCKMADITIDVDARAALDMLGALPERLDHAIRGAITDASVLLLREMKTYPTAPADSTYTRTGTLGKNWSKRIEGRGLEAVGIVGVNTNAAPYARYVQDGEFQASIHQDRWLTIQQAAERHEDTINGFFESRIRAELTR